MFDPEVAQAAGLAAAFFFVCFLTAFLAGKSFFIVSHLAVGAAGAASAVGACAKAPIEKAEAMRMAAIFFMVCSCREMSQRANARGFNGRPTTWLTPIFTNKCSGLCDDRRRAEP